MTLIVKTQIWTSDVWMFFLVPIPIRFDFGRNSLRESKAYTHFHDICLATWTIFLAGYIHNTSIICHSNVSNSMIFFYIIVNDWISWYYCNEDLDIFYTSLLLDNKNQLCAMLLILIFKQRWDTWYMCFFYT